MLTVSATQTCNGDRRARLCRRVDAILTIRAPTVAFVMMPGGDPRFLKIGEKNTLPRKLPSSKCGTIQSCCLLVEEHARSYCHYIDKLLSV
jgi:hypothetical protein